MKVLLTWREVYRCAQIGVYRNVYATSREGWRSQFRPRCDPELWHQTISGTIAEKAVASAAGLTDYWPSEMPDRDVGDVCGWEVRWTGSVPAWLRATAKDPDERACVLVTGLISESEGNPAGAIYAIRGWMTAGEIRAKGTPWKHGAVSIPADALYPGLPPFRSYEGHDPRLDGAGRHAAAERL